MTPIASWLASPPPDAAVEIAPQAVSVAVLGVRGQDTIVQGHAVAPLPPGAVVPSMTSSNITDRETVGAALRTALERAGVRARRVALVIPDLAARVSLVRFDQTPARHEDLDQLIRWQVKKSSPFPVEDACITYSRGARTGTGGDFVVVHAQRSIVREYEAVCEDAGAQAGLVDLATLSVINLHLAGTPPDGDWLLVHMRPEYTSVGILRGRHLIFFRNRPEGGEESLADVVHQTTMYYQDRLSGAGFTHVIMGGGGVPGALDAARRELEAHLRVKVEAIDPTRAAGLTDRISATPESMASLAPLVGMLMRTRSEAAA
jgi:Tfp pilus assembly PilM family ATPase